MPATIEYLPNDTCVLRIGGTLKRAAFAATQNAIPEKINKGAKPRLLVVLDDSFAGWQRGADWNDLDFLISHSGKIVKIAVISEPRWEAHALAFAGAGIRRAPVKFCLPEELGEAEAWLQT